MFFFDVMTFCMFQLNKGIFLCSICKLFIPHVNSLFVHPLHISKTTSLVHSRYWKSNILNGYNLMITWEPYSHLAIYIWKGSLVIFQPNHCEFPPIDYELAASIKLGNLGQLNLPEPPSSVWLMVSHMLFAPIMYGI